MADGVRRFRSCSISISSSLLRSWLSPCAAPLCKAAAASGLARGMPANGRRTLGTLPPLRHRWRPTNDPSTPDRRPPSLPLRSSRTRVAFKTGVVQAGRRRLKTGISWAVSAFNLFRLEFLYFLESPPPLQASPLRCLRIPAVPSDREPAWIL
ncbi:hypothetical protein MRX96_019352 [Rhipicephalus microplus]